MTLLSIITINKNNAYGLQRTVTSLTKYRYDKRIEFIFIDGASVDASLSIARGFYNENEIKSEVDTSVYDAMNKGIIHATGDYLMWLNSGDEIIPSEFTAVLDYLMNTVSDIFSFGLEMYEEGESSPKVIWIPKKEHLPVNTLPHGTTFFRRITFINSGNYSLKYRIASDRDAILRLFFSGCQFEFSDKVIGKFYFGGLSSSPKTRYENLKIDLSYNLITDKEYFFKVLKFNLKNYFSYVRRAFKSLIK